MKLNRTFLSAAHTPRTDKQGTRATYDTAHVERWRAQQLFGLFAALLLCICLTLSGCGISSCTTQNTPAAPSGNAAASLDTIPEYSGALCIDINEGEPGFSEADLAADSFEEYSQLDKLGRCGTAFALIGPETLSSEPRGDISEIHPSGWHQAFYDFVDQEALYNRSHLIAHHLAGENANELNLITGTRTMNAVGMLYYEELVADWVEDTDGHVLYRVTPLFEGNELVARGVQMEGLSVEDGGQAVHFNVFVYNVEPGVAIDYSSGYSWESNDVPAVSSDGDATRTTG